MHSHIGSYSLPTPLEDELAAGLLARHTKLNAFRSIDAAIKEILRLPRWPSDMEDLEKIAEFFGVEPLVFIQRHALSKQTYTRYLRSGKFFGSGPVNAVSSLRWCPNCAATEEEKYGFSYWHRNHQLHGLDWCYQHLIPLWHVDKSCISKSPHTLADSSTPALSVKDLQGELQDYPALVRLQGMLLEWVRYQPRVHISEWLRAVLGAKWGERVKLVSRDSGTLPPDKFESIVREHFPESWRRRHFGKDYDVYDPSTHLSSQIYSRYEFDTENLYMLPSLLHAMLLVSYFPKGMTGMLRVAAAMKRSTYPTTKQQDVQRTEALSLISHHVYAACYPGLGLMRRAQGSEFERYAKRQLGII